MSINYSLIAKTLGALLVFLTLAMLPCLVLAILWGEQTMMISFSLTMLIMLPTGLFLWKRITAKSDKLRSRDAILVVALAWLTAIFAGTLPYAFSGTAPSYASALFESASGFTTTGVTIFQTLETLPRSLLFWRSFSQWIGGLGLIMLTVCLHPVLGMRDQSMGTAETPESPIGNFSPYFSGTAKVLYGVYCTFTALCILLLLLSGLDLFDSFTFAFGSMASSGLTPYTDGIIHLNNPIAEWIVAGFSIVSCINFMLYFLLAKRRIRDFFQDVEIRVFLGILAVSSVLIIWNLHANQVFHSFSETLRYGLFQTIAFLTTTGNTNIDFQSWPTFSQFALFSLAFVGGCAASTCGGIKVNRILIMFRMIWRGFNRRVHPNAVFPVKIQGKTIYFEIVTNVITFIVAYFGFFLMGCLVLSLENMDILTTVSASASMLGNLGTGFGSVGITGNYSIFSDPSKVFLALEMLVGRLELFIIVLLFTPRFWNPDK